MRADPVSQYRRTLTLTSSFTDDNCEVRTLRGREAVSEPFVYEVEIDSPDHALQLQQSVGQGMSVGVMRTGAGPRWIHGMVTRFAQTPGTVRTAGYRAELRPWLWLLTLRADCRIFQGKNVPSILSDLFKGRDVRFDLTGKYDPREFCVQYRETDFAFASRLMEEEGISYYFEHQEGSHTLVLVDDAAQFAPCPELKAAQVRPAGTSKELDDAVTACTLEHAVTTDRVLLDDYDFTSPATSLLASSAGSQAASVVFDYPGGYTLQSSGERLARLRWEARAAGAARLSGQGTCRGFVAGHSFTLAGHERPDANTKYVLRGVWIEADQESYANEFEAFPATTAFRPEPRTPRPAIAGTQTAVVVGKSGEEIWTDSYGRVKVQFHWDRVGKNDENSSCWVRVAQGWAGKGWGGLVLPRIGQEVVVTFLDGDPDRPLVTGCVYNAAQTVPYPLPGAQTRSTFRSNSTPGGAAYSEIRFEDKKDAEELYLHAGRDLTVDVVNNRAATVQKGDDTLSVQKGKRTVTVAEGDEALTVSKGTRTVKVQGAETHENGDTFTHKTGGDYVLNVTGNLTIKASGSITLQAGTELTAKAGTSLTTKAGTGLQATAGTTFQAKGGISSEVASDGITTVKGTLVKVNA
ncbi:MAG TPA: type VI secretion system tip protein TssI/VgrG [Longimicrobium sp.]|nr:type VI secretion system tip protein TssI/VgrG [Longimicrobium sp.]